MSSFKRNLKAEQFDRDTRRICYALPVTYGVSGALEITWTWTWTCVHLQLHRWALVWSLSCTPLLWFGLAYFDHKPPPANPFNFYQAAVILYLLQYVYYGVSDYQWFIHLWTHYMDLRHTVTAAPWTSLVKLSEANSILAGGACLSMPAQFSADVSFGRNSPCV